MLGNERLQQQPQRRVDDATNPSPLFKADVTKGIL